MNVQARFYVSKTTRQAYNPAHLLVELTAVSRGDQNAQWAEATPCGKIEMTINNPEAAAPFEQALGKDVAVTFEFVEILKPEDGHAFRQSVLPEGIYHGGAGTCGDCGGKQAQHAA
jgi:hypothetical protein